jgi:hypothetical protein
MPRRPAPATVALPKGDAGTLPIRRRLTDADVELMRRAVLAGRSEHDVIQDQLAAFAVEVAAAGGRCTEGPQLLQIRDPLRLYVVARVRPAEVAQRLALPEPPATPIEQPIGLGAVRERERSAQSVAHRRRRPRAPHWPGWMFMLVAALCALALTAPHLPALGDTLAAQRLASLPWWAWLAPLLPWLARPAREGWRWTRRQHRPHHRKGCHR